MDDELVTVSRAHLIKVVEKAYVEGWETSKTSTNPYGPDYLYSMTKEQLSKLLRGE